MRLTWTTSLPQDEKFRQQWNALVLRMEKPEVFYTWEWVAAFTRSYAGSVEPWIATAYEGDELAGIAALVKSSATEASFLTAITADYCDFVSLPEKRKELVAQVLSDVQRAGITTLVLANLPADSATAAAIKVSPTFRKFLRTGYICAQVGLGSEEEKQSLIATVFKKKMLRRSMNAMLRVGPVRLQHELGSGLQGNVIKRFCNTHVARFLATGRISNLVDARRRDFLRRLAELLAEKGWFDLMILRAGTQVVALNYGFRFHGSWFWYQPTIVNRFEDMSPGYCLLAKMVEAACNDPEAHLVDLGLGAEGYKERFANQQRTTLHATLTTGNLDLWKVKGRYHAAEGVKRISSLESVARRARVLVRGSRERIAEKGWARTLADVRRRLQRLMVNADEVAFFRWCGAPDEPEAVQGLVPLTWEILAEAAMRYSEDSETMAYLLRSAERLRVGQRRGYALAGEDKIALHFAWVATYEGFAIAELRETLSAPSPSSFLIFDCWTPRELRGQGLYPRAIRQLARMLSAEGKDAWIFSATGNSASLAGIAKAGFQMETSITTRKVLWARSRQESRKSTPAEPPGTVSPGAVR